MLKRRDSPYVPGRKVGHWYKWKRDPLNADCVLMYAARGSGKRSSFYSDYTFGCWNEAGELLPVGKAYFGFTDEELMWLDRFVRNNTVQRFGPVREVKRSLVLEVAFDSIHESKRHKIGPGDALPARVEDQEGQARVGSGHGRDIAADGGLGSGRIAGRLAPGIRGIALARLDQRRISLGQFEMPLAPFRGDRAPRGERLRRRPSPEISQVTFHRPLAIKAPTT